MKDANGNELAPGQKVWIACKAFIADGIRVKRGRVTHFIPAAKEGPRPEPETALVDEVFTFAKNKPMGRFTSEHIFSDAVSASDWSRAQARVMLEESARKYELYTKNLNTVIGGD